MCVFMSWIVHRKQTLFLTDQDIFSGYGRKVLKGCKPEDYISHGAIRRYYGLGDIEGRDYENDRFWEIKNHEIQEALKDFNNFKRIWEAGALQISNLINMAHLAPYVWRERAVRQLLKQNPEDSELCCVLTYPISDEMKAQVGEQLLKQKPSINALIHIVCYSSESNREKAWKQLLLMKCVAKSDIDYIIRHAPAEWEEKAKVSSI